MQDENKTLYIIVAGDGAEYAYLFKPIISSGNVLSYTLVWKELYSGDTVGEISIADINHDGYAEFVVPLYEKNLIKVYTFAP